MFVYTKNQITNKYDVGFYDNNNAFHKTSEYKYEADAAHKTHYLNGGKPESKWKQLIFMYNDWGARLAV